MKRNYLAKTWFNRLYLDDYNDYIEGNVLEFFKYHTSINKGNLNSYCNRHNTLEQYLYYLNVWSETNRNIHLIKDINKRGLQYHLDHIIPISFGFKKGIDFKLIGSSENLQIIPSKENSIKAAFITDKAIEILNKYGINYSNDVQYNKTFIELDIKTSYYKRVFKTIHDVFYLEDSKHITILNLNTGEKVKELTLDGV